eukprot:6207314-Pleurochrysis_carterae.AAC.2
MRARVHEMRSRAWVSPLRDRAVGARCAGGVLEQYARRDSGHGNAEAGARRTGLGVPDARSVPDPRVCGGLPSCVFLSTGLFCKSSLGRFRLPAFP